MECQAGYGEFLDFGVGIDCSRRLPFEFQPLTLPKETVAPLFQNLGANTPFGTNLAGLSKADLSQTRRRKHKPKSRVRILQTHSFAVTVTVV